MNVGPSQSQAAKRVRPKSADSDPQAAAIFIHGLGTTDLDLRPLAQAFADRGVRGTLLTLKGHGDQPVDDLSLVTVTEWLDQLRQAVDSAMEQHNNVYLVGFSTGATLALRVAAERDVAGVFCVSTFVRPARPRLLVRLALRLRYLPPIGSRRPRVSTRRVRKELKWTPRLPTSTVARVIAEAPALSAVPRDRRVLFVHSVDDPVADYSGVAEIVKEASSDDVRLISLSGLAHFVQFDIPSHVLCRVAFAHFHPGRRGPDRRHPSWVDNVKQREDEVRHWANVLSLLFLGFFTVFGTLARATLPEVTSKADAAPYLLFAYALLIAAYLQFAFLYLFYMNRNQVYLKTYIDPIQEGGVGWTFYRTTRWVSGRASGYMTRLVASAGTLLPLLAATFSVTYAIWTYHSRLFDFASENLVLQLIALVAVCWLILVAYTGGTLVKYSKVHLYKVPPIVPASHEFLVALRDLYASIERGIVRQPTVQVSSTRTASEPAIVS